MNKEKIIYYQGRGAIIDNKVADQHGLKDGQTIHSKKDFLNLLQANAEYNIQELKIILEKEDKKSNDQ